MLRSNNLNGFGARRAGASCTPQGNPSNTKLLIHSDTTDGSTTFVDSADARAITPVGNVQHKINQSQLGMSSIYYDEAGDYLTIPGGADFQFGTGDFTVDLFVRYETSITSNERLVSNYVPGNLSWELRYSTSNGVQWGVSTNGTTIANTFSFATTFAADTWYYIKVTRESGNLKVFIDGSQIGSTQTDSNSYYASTDEVWIGAKPTGSNYFGGWMDEIRIVKGEAKDGAEVPTTPYCDAS